MEIGKLYERLIWKAWHEAAGNKGNKFTPDAAEVNKVRSDDKKRRAKIVVDEADAILANDRAGYVFSRSGNLNFTKLAAAVLESDPF